MPNLTSEFVYFASGSHTRQPRSSGGGFQTLLPASSGTLTTGDVYPVGPFPQQLPGVNPAYQFSFVNVSGGTGGPSTHTSSGDQFSVTVGSDPIVVLAVYVPIPGGGHGVGSAGATIDSLDLTTNALFSDTFVKVTPDPGNTLTTSGNVDGWVPTGTAAETIAALSPASPSGNTFVQWLNLDTSATSSSPQLALAQNASEIALALYKSPAAAVVPPPNACQQELKSLWQIIDDGDRPLLTVAMYNGIAANLQKCVVEGQLKQADVTAALDAYKARLNQPTPPTPGPKQL